MRIYFYFILLSFSVKGQTLEVQQPSRFLSLGDSYTIGQNVSVSQRWPVQLKDSLLARGIISDTLRVIATTGWTTTNLKNAISNQGLQNQNYNLVSLLIGVNNQYQGKPLSLFLTEFPQLIDSAIRYAGGDTNRVFIVSIPDYAYTPFGQSNGNATQISQQIDQYNAISKHIADSLRIKYFDITPISRLGLIQTDLVASDGLHPSGKQYSKWVELMLHYIDSVGLTTVPGFVNEKEVLKFFPNPVTDFVFFDFPNGTSESLYEVKLFSIDGKLVKSEKLIDIKKGLFIGYLDEGIYFLKIRSEKGWVENYKFFKN